MSGDPSAAGRAFDLVSVPVFVCEDGAFSANRAGERLLEGDGRLESAPGVELPPGSLCRYEGRLRHVRVDEPVRVFEPSVVPDGARAVVTLVDVTDTQGREDAECLYEWTSELSGAGAWEVDLVSQTPVWSAQVRRIHEVPDDFEPNLESAIDFYAPEARPVIRGAVERAIATGEGWDLELPLITWAKRRIWVRAVGKPEYEGGQCIRLRGTFQEITERREHELELQRALDKVRDFERVFETAPTMQAIADFTGHFLVVNPMWTKILGWSVEELCSGPYTDFVHPDDIEPTYEVAGALAADTSEVVQFGNRYRAKDGTYHWLRWYAVSDIAVGKIYAVAIDVSEERRREAELQRLASVANRTENGVLVTDPAGLVEWVNPAFERAVGYGLDELVGKKPGQMLQGPDTDPAVPRRIGAAVRARRGFKEELINYRKSGEKFWTQVDGQPVFDEAGELLHFVAIQSDVTERKRAEGFLKQAASEAQRAAAAAAEASEAKSRFLANMSHEIRTPLNGVIGMADLLLEREQDEAQQRLVSTIRSSGQVLLDLINDLLDFSKIEAGQLPLEEVPLDLVPTLDGAVEMGRHVAERKGLKLQLELPKSLPFVFGDAQRLRQIVTNLVSNAVKFTDRGHVLVRVRAVQSDAERVGLEIEVEDTGPGIDAEVMPRLFRPFTQADVSTTRRFGGTGLGLSISRGLAEQMGGTLDVTSTAGEGSCFTLRVVLRVAAALEPGQAEAATIAPPTSLSASVLVVEDNKINQRVAEHMLVRAGCDVTLAEDGRMAVDFARRGGFDVILMDCQMPHMDGFEATRRIRALSGAVREVPIIALTANSMEGDRERCLEAGMDDYLAKPIRAEELVAKVGQLIAQRPLHGEPAEPVPVAPSEPVGHDVADPVAS